MRGISMTAESVRGILAGRKTVTRRLVNLGSVSHAAAKVIWQVEPGTHKTVWSVCQPEDLAKKALRLRCPYGRVGERFYVRETWADDAEAQFEPQKRGTFYKATEPEAEADCVDCGIPFAWRPSRYMPRWRSRIVLEVTGLRAERLHEITEADVLAEGLKPPANGPPLRELYAALWDDLNYARAPYVSNPFVWRIAFKRAESMQFGEPKC